MSELAKELVSNGITHVAIVGIKTGHAVQAMTQACCDLGLRVSVLQECVMDNYAKPPPVPRS
jgi:nicotinamidase-related amidase